MEKAEKEVATANPLQATKSFLESLDQQMENNEITSPTELGPEISAKYEELKENTITEPNLIVETKHQISAQIGTLGAQKRFAKLVSQYQVAYQSSNKAQRTSVRDAITSFLLSTNIYDQNLISKRETELKKMKQDLENQLTNQPSQSNSPEQLP
nr:6256_t:CDS:1 [Entrophospora candida]